MIRFARVPSLLSVQGQAVWRAPLFPATASRMTMRQTLMSCRELTPRGHNGSRESGHGSRRATGTTRIQLNAESAISIDRRRRPDKSAETASMYMRL
jgi:hypothetical protein